MTLSDLILTNGEYSAFTFLRIKFESSPCKPFHIGVIDAAIAYGEYEVELFRGGNDVVLRDGKHERKEKNSTGGGF